MDSDEMIPLMVLKKHLIL